MLLIYVKIPEYGYMEHGLEYITFYIQKHLARLAVCSGLPLVRQAAMGAHISEICLIRK